MPDRLDSHDIKDLRRRAKMSLREMGEYLGVATFTVHRWEKEQSKPSLLAMRQLHRLHKKVENGK